MGRPRRGDRISKWDRPPDPHDWRFFVGNLGKVLIATGLLLFGFVAYQLWGTGIETAAAQNDLEQEFESRVPPSTSPSPATSSTSTRTTGGTASTVPQASSPTPTSDDLDAIDVVPPSEPMDGAPSSFVPGGVDLSDQAVPQELPPIRRGDVLARLQIPRIDKDLYVVAGVGLADLKNGPGHYPDTPFFGQLGNASVAGHRTTYGAPFFDVDQLRPGDELITTTILGDRYVYEVTGTEVVSASDYFVVSTRDPTVAELTLTSCDPKYTARNRIVVHSVLDPAKSSQVGTAGFYQIDDAPADDVIPGDDPTFDITTSSTIVRTGEPLTTADVTPEATAVPSGDSVPGTVGDTTVGDTAGTVAGGAGSVTTTTIATLPTEDVFTQGWFGDRDAWPQIALWGTLLTVISLAAYAVSRRFRHDSIGFLVGVGPFLFALYFFFQNINRLLPPGL